jgi:trehalose synthase
MQAGSHGSLTEVSPDAHSLERYAELIGGERVRALQERSAALAQRLGGGAVWNVNSTAVGGGVAEMLRPLVGYARGAGIDCRWGVIEGDPEFFKLTKRIHHALHGSLGDGTALDADARAAYEATMRHNAADLAARIGPEDIVILHDPQTVGLVKPLLEVGARVVWRCHIGHDQRNDEVDRGWAFLTPYLERVEATVFSRGAYIPDCCDKGRAVVIQPGIDAFSPKNQPMAPEVVDAILVETGILEGPPPPGVALGFVRSDGTPGRVERAADVLRLGRAVRRDVPMVLQVSRWDPLKDPVGVIEGFRQILHRHPGMDADLVLAGPNVKAVADDPEGDQVYESVVRVWRELPHALRKRVHLAMLPTADVSENAAIVNALQRRAHVIVQKSLHEGFGLTVTEAMWKGRPVLASAVGGIQDQIEDGVSGVLLRDPSDREAFARALFELLDDPARAERIGVAGRERVRENFLGIRQLEDYTALLERLLTADRPRSH